MNCKPGELAFVVKSWSGNEGKVVKCLYLVDVVRDYKPLTPGPFWVIDRQLSRGVAPSTNVIADACLRPIRPGDMSDETPTEVIKKLTEPA